MRKIDRRVPRAALTIATALTLGLALSPPLLLQASGPADAAPPSYVVGTPTVAAITNGTASAPWNTSQGDGSPAYSSVSPGTLLPTYTPGGGTVASEPNLAVYPSANSGTAGVSPYPSGVAGTPGPLDGYCGSGGPNPETGAVNRQPAGSTLPFAPYYFPHVVRNGDGSLTGYFDYRPKDADEAIVAATSTDNGATWTYDGEALQQSPTYCPTADNNDDGQGHPNVLTVNGTSYLYTLQRPAGDSQGVGLLVHALNPTPSNPLNGLPAAEPVGIDPDAFATAATTVPFTGGTPVTIPVTSTGATGSLEQLLAGEFVDLTKDPVPTATTVITCTGTTPTSLTGCTTPAASGIAVTANDLIEQVIATVSTAATIPTGPNLTTGGGGLGTLSVSFANAATGTVYNNNAPNRAYVDGIAVYCNQANALPTTKMENCTTGSGGPAVSAAVGDPVTSDPIIPATAAQTNGLIAPDGIVGVLPSYPGAPAGATIIAYTEKIAGFLSYYDAGYTGGATTFAANMTITFTPTATVGSVLPAPGTVSASSPVTVSIGDNTADIIVSETCTSLTSGASYTLGGCNGGTVGHAIAKNSFIGGAGACTASAATLAPAGEGSATNAQKLLKNNEDFTILRVAYTTDGINFSSSGLGNNGIISGDNTGGASYNDISNPAQTTSPANLNAYATPGTPDATELRFIGSAGSILTDPDGSYAMFLSGSWCGDGDSDAFNQIFYTTSVDGQHWSVPTSVVSTDYTFAASAAQDAGLAANQDLPLGVSAYYSGRAYGPSVVSNADGSLTMIFAGYRVPKTIVNAGTVLGSWTVGTTDPALYRNIMAVTLTPSTAPVLPESRYPIALPVLAVGLGGAVIVFARRRRSRSA